MTLRKPKYSERKKLEEIMEKKQREVEKRRMLPPYTLIISEGIKTEPYYIKGLVKLVNENCIKACDIYWRYMMKDRIKVHGTGRNTKSLLEYARNYAKEPENKHYSRIWIMYDKDDFPLDNFDNTQFSISDKECNDADRKFFAAWSNECIELWFILYFQELTADVGREQYKEILKRYFDYDKSAMDLYDILDKNGDINLAISRAKKLFESYVDKTPTSRMIPATLVYKLVEELRGYLQ